MGDLQTTNQVPMMESSAIDLLLGNALISDSFVETFDLSREPKLVKFYFHLYLIYQMAKEMDLQPATIFKPLKSRKGESLFDVAYSRLKRQYKLASSYSDEQYKSAWHTVADILDEWQLAKPDNYIYTYIKTKRTRRLQ